VIHCAHPQREPLTQRLHRPIDDLAENFRRIVSVSCNLRILHDRLQLPDPDHSDCPGRAPVHPRRIEFSVITQWAMTFGQLLGAFSVIVNQYSRSPPLPRSSPDSSVSSRPPRPRTRLDRASLLTKIAGECLPRGSRCARVTASP